MALAAAHPIDIEIEMGNGVRARRGERKRGVVTVTQICGVRKSANAAWTCLVVAEHVFGSVLVVFNIFTAGCRAAAWKNAFFSHLVRNVRVSNVSTISLSLCLRLHDMTIGKLDQFRFCGQSVRWEWNRVEGSE